MALLRAPLLALKWLVVATAVLVWLVVAPVVDVVVDAFGRVWRWVSRGRDSRGSG